MNNNFLPIYETSNLNNQGSINDGMSINSQNYTGQNVFNSVNLPYGYCLLPSNAQNRQGVPGPDQFGNGVDYTNCVPQIVKSPDVIGPQNTSSVNNLDNYFLTNQGYPQGSSYIPPGGPIDLQSTRPEEIQSYVTLASRSLNVSPDPVMMVYFSDSNINHLRNTIVKKVKEITADSGVAGTPEGVTIKTPNMDDLFYYMLNIYQTYKITNGSIVFVNLKKNTDIKSEIAKLNTNILQDYISKLISQINMYIYYYQDASQLPQQLSRPVYTSMKGSRELEYNVGFTSGNSIGIASYNQVGNII
jgi:hypothetical protein